MKNIVEVIESETKDFLHKPAIIDGKRRATYAGLLAGVHEAAGELKNISVKKGKRVALLAEDSLDYVILSLAVLKLSAVIVPIPVTAAGEEIEAVLKEMKADLLIFEKGSYCPRPAKRLKIPRVLDKEFFFLSRPSAGQAPKEFFSMDPAFIRFSSGTTGVRKGVVISQEGIIQRTDAADKGLRVTSEDTVLWVLSMSFHFVVTILLFLRRGATIVLAGNSFPGSLLAALYEHRPSFIYASPLHYHLLARLKTVSREQLAGVRLAVSTSVRLPPQVAQEFRAKFGFELSEAYGIIEVGLPFINISRSVSKRGSVGRVLPDYQIKIIRQGRDKAGEICLKGKGLFCAYFSPWKSGKAILPGGWFPTGDVGRVDRDGFLFILGRAKNVINFNGMKIFPAEVESVLNRHPAVQESRVRGVPHPEYGSLPAADIVLRKGREAAFDEQGLRAFCYRHLAKYKVPKEFRLVEKLERTLSGKLRREI